MKKFNQYGFTIHCRDYISNREFDMILREINKQKIDITSNIVVQDLMPLFSELSTPLKSFVRKVDDEEGNKIEVDIEELPANVMFHVKMYMFECFQGFANELEDTKAEKKAPETN